MRYRIRTYGENGRQLDDRVCENEASLGGVIAHSVDDCDRFTVCDADDLNGEIIMRYSKGGF